MKNISTYENDLIIKYFTGEATPEEIVHLSGWIKSDPENEKIFEEYKAAVTAVDISIAEKIDIDDEWEKMNRKISKGFIINKKNKNSFFLKIAAVVIILLIPAFFLFRYLSAPVEKTLVATNGIIEDQLPDGTNVTLNKGSEINYSAFRGKERGVKLKGEAYFRVAHNKARPFIVSGDDARIEVLGTSFLVNTDAGEGHIEVVLDTGRVAIYKAGSPDEKIFLEPGEKAVISGGVISVDRNSDRNYMSWKTGKLVFVNDSLSSIISVISKIYKTRISLSARDLQSCRVTATFDHQSPESMLNVLKETLSLSLEKNSEGYIISGKSCSGQERGN